ncbi:hypothetical protein [Xylocopilactobacillus apicola]|uniref:Uncharacterized protein n=1 Tax=Xylocopilactobacillus apicola TaxID=2932184 RepID=A0AAU9CWC2_9LACO|nr:hypothetical protein [Xylocopilactobacillus apicola]BDR58259.1 hypothetical protein XA3_07000 [Xylocopilactobacillus apicola]
MDKSEKQPFYKTWWFWLIIIVLVIGVVIGINQTSKSKSTGKSASSSSSKVVKKPQPVTDKDKAKSVAQTVIFDYLTKEKKQKISKSDVEITSIKNSGPYYVKKSQKARMNGWEIQGKINSKSKGSSIDLLSAVINMPDQDKNQLDYLAIGWDTFINEVKQNTGAK